MDPIEFTQLVEFEPWVIEPKRRLARARCRAVGPSDRASLEGIGIPIGRAIGDRARRVGG